MSWQLNTDGIDDWLNISTIELLVGDYLEFDYTPVSGNLNDQYRLAGNKEGFANTLVFRPDVGLRIKASSLTTDLALPLPPVDVRTQLKIERTNGTTYQVSIDGSTVGTVNNSGKMVLDALLGLNTVPVTGASLHYKGGLHAVTFVSSTPSLSRSWSADASDHSNTGVQPVLLDTIAGNNAVGVDMDTDGSVWFNSVVIVFKSAWAKYTNNLIGGM